MMGTNSEVKNQLSQEKIYQVALSMVPGVGDIIAKTLVSYCGSASEVFKKNKSQLSKIPGIGTVNAQNIHSFKNFSAAESEIKKCENLNYKILFITDKDYPKKLKHAPDSPVVLFYKGSADLNGKKTISIVGTRKSTSYGREFTEKIVEQLKAHQAQIISGLAYGIDICAHKAALKNGMETIGVMASGLDIIYPSSHKGVALEMLESGGLITEFATGEKPEAHNFPARNRIIAGMSDAVIVIEAAAKGGALITAEIANSYNRDVFALPGDVGRKFSEGCNNLIKQNKAVILTSIEDIEYVMNWQHEAVAASNDEKYYDFSALTPDEKTIIEMLKTLEDGILIDELSWKSQIPLNKLASILLNLEFSGIIKPLPGKKFKLK
ncbi:MAG: DNA-processing protein DprA [Cyclobacteriaceae bacterium]|nr:DNA-processing protein DprA [Cyclobacteriaceae bacterium]